MSDQNWAILFYVQASIFSAPHMEPEVAVGCAAAMIGLGIYSQFFTRTRQP